MPQSDEPSDELLAVRCQLGDDEAWRSLVTRWHPRLWRFVFGMLSNRAVAEDVLQTVWLRVVRTLGTLEHPDRFAAWIYRIARRSVVDRLRVEYRQPVREPLWDVAEEEAETRDLELVDELQQALRELHPHDREAVVLHYLEHYSIADIAAICGVPQGTVKSRLHRARRLLRTFLEQEHLDV